MSDPGIRHTVIPVAVILAAVVLLITGHIDLSTALTMISTAGSYGAIATLRREHHGQ